jgi:hypothetical protein
VATSSDGIPAPDTTTAAEAATSPSTSDATAGDLVASTGPAGGAPSSPSLDGGYNYFSGH